MGPVSGRLRGTVRRWSAAGVAVLLAALLGGVLPAAAKEKDADHPGNAYGHEKQAAREEAAPAPQAAAPAPAPAAEPAPPPAATPAPAEETKEERKAEKTAEKAERRATPRLVPAEPAPAPAPVATPVAAAPAPAATPRPERRAAPSAERRRPRRADRAVQSSPTDEQAARSAPVTVPPAQTAEPAVAPVTTRDAEPRREERRGDRPSSSVPGITVAFDALSRSVAFVPRAAWAAIGALGLLVLAFMLVAFVRDRHARRLGREREALLADLRALEGAVFPHVPEALGGVALSAASAPASGFSSGNDFHDAFALSADRTAVIVGDVAGHGRQAVADAQLVRHAVRAYLEAGLDPRGAIAMTGAVVDERHEPLFGSVIVAVHDRRDGSLTFASAGHEPPILVSEQGAGVPPVTGWSPPLGTGLETGRRQTRMPLPQGTSICLVTDGVTEARSGGDRVGLAGLTAWLNALGPGAMASELVARLRDEADTADEDVTVCMIRALSTPAPWSPRIEEAIVEGGDPSYLVRFLRDCGLPRADAEEAGAALAAQPDGTRMVASVEIRGGRAVVELAPLGAATSELTV